MQETVLETNALTKRYSMGCAVDAVSMTVRRGDIYGVIGQNGAGKTTLIRMVTGLISPTSGEIALFGEAKLDVGRKRIGCIVEGPAFYPKMSAEQNLEYFRIQRGIPNKAAVEQALEVTGLAKTGKKKYAQFSLGMKQRLGLALAIMGKPDFLILDEPINGLDPMGIVEFRGIIQELNHKHDMTVLISSHILAELTQVATTYGIIHNGRLIKQVSSQQLEEETRRCISVKVDYPDIAATILEEKMHISDYEVLPDGELRIYASLENPSEVNFQLSTGGVRVQAMNEIGVNLEDYFIQAIQKEDGGKSA